jgi:hypothetical protein
LEILVYYPSPWRIHTSVFVRAFQFIETGRVNNPPTFFY